MKKYFILTNYSEFYTGKLVLLKAASEEGAYAYINKMVDRIIRESVLAGLEVTDVTRDDTKSFVTISDYKSGIQYKREYTFQMTEVDSITDFDKWYMFINESTDDDNNWVEMIKLDDLQSACERMRELIELSEEVYDCNSVINWTTRTATVGDDEYVLMSVQEMLEIK